MSRRKYRKIHTFFIFIKKTYKNGEELTKLLKLSKFNGSRRSVVSSLSSYVGNLAEGIHKIKCKYKNDNKK